MIKKDKCQIKKYSKIKKVESNEYIVEKFSGRKRIRDILFHKKDPQPTEHFKKDPWKFFALMANKTRLLKVLNYFIYMQSKYGITFTSQTHIGEIVGLTGVHCRNSVADICNLLEEYGFLIRNFRQNNTCIYKVSSYFLIPQVRKMLSKYLSALRLPLLWENLKKRATDRLNKFTPHKYYTPLIIYNYLTKQSSSYINMNTKFTPNQEKAGSFQKVGSILQEIKSSFTKPEQNAQPYSVCARQNSIDLSQNVKKPSEKQQEMLNFINGLGFKSFI